MRIKIPYGHTHLEAEIPEERIEYLLEPEQEEEQGKPSPSEHISHALEHPIESPRLRALASKAQNIVVVTSDHTRPLPSHLTIPRLLAEIREGNPSADITILIATGLHRAPTDEEMIAKFGSSVVANEHFVAHDALAQESLVRLKDLPSGAPLWVNRLAVEADLLIAEGFIEPHFFAGFSGGRKSILPGICGKETILINHSARFIDHEATRSGTLEGNIFHRDMVDAAQQVQLKYIFNVALDHDKNILKAFAGEPQHAFEEGVQFVNRLTRLTCPRQADIVVTSNGGYPLDQNLYQAVKGIRTAEAAVKKGGVIITAASCVDGIGGEMFLQMLTSKGADELLREIRATDPAKTSLDQWQVQVLLRTILNHRVIVITEGVDSGVLQQMGLENAKTLDEALQRAYTYMGDAAKVTVIPNGAAVYVEAEA